MGATAYRPLDEHRVGKTRSRRFDNLFGHSTFVQRNFLMLINTNLSKPTTIAHHQAYDVKLSRIDHALLLMRKNHWNPS